MCIRDRLPLVPAAQSLHRQSILFPRGAGGRQSHLSRRECEKAQSLSLIHIWEQPLYQLARQVGSVFQNPKSQFFNLDSDSELAFGLENQGVARGEILRSLDDTTNRLHLKRLRGRNIFAMSGGEKQLLAFASVYAMGPELYILDEPTANLDRDTIDRLHDQIVYLKSRGHTILIAEHRLYFLADLIDRAVYLRDGVCLLYTSRCV